MNVITDKGTRIICLPLYPDPMQHPLDRLHTGPLSFGEKLLTPERINFVLLCIKLSMRLVSLKITVCPDLTRLPSLLLSL